MPRQARIDAPGAVHHIICRGIERRQIFKDDVDRDDFVARLTALCKETSTDCLAWALIPNHFHLLLRTGQVPVATVMRRLLTGYAVKFNRRHGRSGHLFQNRYKSILCQEELYLLELVRYIHLNPLRAHQVASMEELKIYPYSGHRCLMGQGDDGLQNEEIVLARFGKQRSAARKSYASFVAAGASQGQRADLTGGGLIRSSGGWQKVLQSRRASLEHQSDERILGEGSFVEEVLRQAEEAISRREEARQQGFTFEELLKAAAQRVGLTPEDLLHPGKQPLRVYGRSLLCYWAVRELGMTATEVGRKIDLTQPAVSRAVSRGEKLATEKKMTLPPRNA